MTALFPKLITNSDDLKHATVRLADRPMLAFSLKADGLDAQTNKAQLLVVGDDQEQIVVDCRSTSLDPLQPLLSGSVPKVTHDGASAVAMFRAMGIRVEHVLDTSLIEQVSTNGRTPGPVGLADLASKYLGRPLDNPHSPKLIRAHGDFSESQLEEVRHEVLATYLILLEQMPSLVEENLESTARLECRVLPAFGDLAFDGIYLDHRTWKGLIDDASQARNELREKIDEQFSQVVQTDLFGRVDVNYDSESELRGALSKLLDRPVRDLNKQALRRLGHPVGEMLVEYREKSKLVSTYGESFLDAVHPKSGRIHANFIQIGAPTGRVACRDPNLQNIPRGSEFRACFSAPQSRRLVTADYSGCELRILAEASRDPAFVNTFQRGGDLHSIVASEIFNTQVTKERNSELRNRAKAINFGLAYGMGAGGLAAVTGLIVEEAEKLLGRYFAAFPHVRDYLEDSAQTAIERGFAVTLGGRKLYLEIGERLEARELSAIARVAKNMPIQGTSADMLKVAMTGIRHRMLDENLDGFMVNCVHDEILLEVSESSAWDASELVREEMIKAGERYISQVPVTVDVSVDQTWQK